jgi:hypothetical protein
MLVAIKEETDDKVSPRTTGKKKRGSYMSSFSHDLWPLILEAITKYNNLLDATVTCIPSIESLDNVKIHIDI